MVNPSRILPQTVQAEDNQNLRGILLPGDHLFVDEDQESVGLRVMHSTQLIPGQLAKFVISSSRPLSTTITPLSMFMCILLFQDHATKDSQCTDLLSQ